MTENYFKNHSDHELAHLCLEQLKYNKTKKHDYSRNYGKENRYFQDLQTEIVHRFINKYKEGCEVKLESKEELEDGIEVPYVSCE